MEVRLSANGRSDPAGRVLWQIVFGACCVDSGWWASARICHGSQAEILKMTAHGKAAELK